MRLVLDGAFETAGPHITTPPPSTSRGIRFAWIVTTAAVLCAVLLAIPAVRHLRETPPLAVSETRVDIVTLGLIGR